MMLGNQVFWKRFEESGSVKDYLEYACTTEDSMSGVVVGDVIEDNCGSVACDWDEHTQLY